MGFSKGNLWIFPSCFKVNLSMVSWDLPRKDARWSWAFEHFSWQGREMRSWNHKRWHGHVLRVSPTMPAAIRFFHILHVKNRFSLSCANPFGTSKNLEKPLVELCARFQLQAFNTARALIRSSNFHGVLEGFPFREGWSAGPILVRGGGNGENSKG